SWSTQITKKKQNDKEVTKGTDHHPKCRPFGFHAMKLNIEKNKHIKDGRVQGEIVCEGWAYLPLLLSWTIPAIWKRGFYRILIVKYPSEVFEKIQVIVDNNPKDKLKFNKTCNRYDNCFIINSLSLGDSTYRLLYTPGESDLIMSGKGWLHVWFSTCGFSVAFLLLFLGIFTGYNTLWVDLFGDAYDLSSIGCY
ncbi:6779_t:CDS:2, partial [Funneliformis mosseae]